MVPEAGGISLNPIHAAELKQRIRIKSRATLTVGRNQQVRPRCRRIPVPEVCRISGRRHSDWRWVWGECHLCDRSLARRCGHVEWGWAFCQHLCDRSLARRWQSRRCFLPDRSLAREGMCQKSGNGVKLRRRKIWWCFLPFWWCFLPDRSRRQSFIWSVRRLISSVRSRVGSRRHLEW